MKKFSRYSRPRLPQHYTQHGQCHRIKSNSAPLLFKWSLVALVYLFVLCGAHITHGQQIALSCNDETNWSQPAFSGLTISHSINGPSGTQFTGEMNVIDGNTTNFGTMTLSSFRDGFLCSNASPASGSIRVSDNNAYNLGNYVGFITSTNLSVFNSVVLSAINGTVPVSSTATPIISDLGDGTYEVGFITQGSGTFNGIQLSLTLNAPALCATNTESVNIFRAFQVKYCPENNLPANIASNINLPDFNVSTSSSGGNLLQLLLLGGVVDDFNVISRSTDDYARIMQVLTNLGDKFFQVRDNITTYPAGTFAGFEISRDDVLGLSLLGSITIQARLNGTVVDSQTGPGLLLGASLLSGSNRNIVGFTSVAAFNEVRIVFQGASVGVGETRIYNVVIQRFEEGATLPCNTPTNITTPAYPVTLSSSNTGITGAVCVGCSIGNAYNLLDTDVTNTAEINLIGSVGAIGSISVKKELSSYSPGTFAGFDIENANLLGLELFNSIKITTYLDGAQQESASGGSGLLNVGLLNGARQTIGFLAKEEFDEVKISIEQLVGVSLGQTLIHALVIQSFCNDGPLICNTPVNVTNPGYSVFVNVENTGIDAAVCAACSLTNTQALVSSSSDEDFATMVLGVSVGSNGKISIKNAITNYPAGSYTGFDVALSSLLDIGALSAIRIRTYLDGTETAASVSPGYSGSGLVVNAGLLTASGRQIIGVISEDAFDEVQIEFTNLASINLGTIRIYNAVFQQMCNENPIVCNTTARLIAPLQPVVIESSRTGLSGAVCAICQVRDIDKVISADATDFGFISLAAGIGASGSISVKNAVVDYGGGSTVGFAIRDLHNLIQLNLFESITLSTYLNGVPTGENSSGTALISLDLLVPIISSGTGVYNVGFSPTLPFDEIRLTVSSLASVLNEIEVFGAFVSPFTTGCTTPVLTFNEIPATANRMSPYNSAAVPVGTYTGENEIYSTVPGIGNNTLPTGLSINNITGIIDGIPNGETGAYEFTVEVHDESNSLIGQKTYSILLQEALPVKLVSLAAQKEGTATMLNWITTEEINSERFDLERSVNGKVWENIGSEPAMGDSKALNHYSFMDKAPLSGFNYYRLRMIDLDKTFAYSKIVEVFFDSGTTTMIYPNPVVDSENIRLNVHDWSKIKTVKLINSMGKTVFESDKALTSGISANKLSSGTYVIEITQTNGIVNTYRLMRQ